MYYSHAIGCRRGRSTRLCSCHFAADAKAWKATARKLDHGLRVHFHETWVRNIINAFVAADNNGFTDRGLAWYGEVREWATEVGLGLGRHPSIVAAALAVMSPATRFERLVDDVLRVADAALTGRRCPRVSGYRRNVERGYSMFFDLFDATDDTVATRVKPRRWSGFKVYSFWRNIVDWETSTCVTIDRHAWDIGVGQRLGDATRPRIGVRDYRTMAGSYREAASRLEVAVPSIRPCQVQATTWLYWRETVVKETA